MVGDRQRRRRRARKPNPLYLAALELLDVPASETFAVEDSPNGIRAAKAAGIPCVCVPNEATERLDLSEADLVVPTFEVFPWTTSGDGSATAKRVGTERSPAEEPDEGRGLRWTQRRTNGHVSAPRSSSDRSGPTCRC